MSGNALTQIAPHGLFSRPVAASCSRFRRPRALHTSRTMRSIPLIPQFTQTGTAPSNVAASVRSHQVAIPAKIDGERQRNIPGLEQDCTPSPDCSRAASLLGGAMQSLCAFLPAIGGRNEEDHAYSSCNFGIIAREDE